MFILGREILMDIEDMPGDGQTLVKHISRRNAISIGLGLQVISAILLFVITKDAIQAAAASTVTILLFIVIIGWWQETRRPTLLRLMQVQMLAGIAFLA
jgi:peptidoglycan/LPS O-acetylase OafA/YrhL